MGDLQVARLVKYYGINEPNDNDRLWKLALYIMTDKKPKKHSEGTRSYVHQEDVTGVREYYTHDNGGRPFLVRIDEDGIHIYTLAEPEYTKLIDTVVDYQGYWWGFDPTNPKFHGNSILIDITDHEYMYVGESIYRFKTIDVIKDYVSPVGNNKVPYPVAYGDDNVYFMLDRVYIPRNKLKTLVKVDNAEDLYAEFYGQKPQGFSKKDIKKMKNIEIIRKRTIYVQKKN